MTLDELKDEILHLSKEADANFLELAKLLRELYDTLGGDDGGGGLKAFFDCVKAAKISRRKAYYFIEIDRVYGPIKVSRKRLAAIGWTKLSLLARYVDQTSVEEWFKLAEENTAEYIRSFLAFKEPATHILTLRLTDQQYSVIAGTLLGNGCYLTESGGLANKEAALLKICYTLAKAWKAGIT